MVISTSDESIKLLDRSSGELLAEFTGHKTKDYVIENCVNTKDNHVMSGSADGNVYCWELISQKVTGHIMYLWFLTSLAIYSCSETATETEFGSVSVQHLSNLPTSVCCVGQRLSLG